MLENIKEIEFTDFLKLDIRAGTIIDVAFNTKARLPAYILKIDLGDIGIKTSSAQITDNYKPDMLIGKQIITITNFPVKRVAGIKSEVLVLACIDDAQSGTVLLEPSQKVTNGCKVL